MDVILSAKFFLRKILNSKGYEVRPVNHSFHDVDRYLEIYEKESVVQKKFYNIGAGTFNHPVWTNVDFYSDWYSDNRKNTKRGIVYDLLSLEKIPIETESAEIVYTSHTLEHVTDEAAQNVLNESFRILKKGGGIRITTPNIDLAYNAFRNKDRYFFIDVSYKKLVQSGVEIIKPKHDASIEQLFLAFFAVSTSTLHNFGAKEKISDKKLNELFFKMDKESMLNYCTSRCPLEIQKKFPQTHINWFNFEKISKMLKIAGFQKIYPSQYGQSIIGILRNTFYFDTSHPRMSLYVDAIK